MKRGELYRVWKAAQGDPRESRVFVIVSRQALIDSSFSTLTCAPVYSRYAGLSTQVELGPEDGLNHNSAIHCNQLLSLPKCKLTDYIGSLRPSVLSDLDRALIRALELEGY